MIRFRNQIRKLIIRAKDECKCHYKNGVLDIFSTNNCICNVEPEELWNWISYKLDFEIQDFIDHDVDKYQIVAIVKDKPTMEECIICFYTKEECEKWKHYEIDRKISAIKAVDKSESDN